MDDTKALRLAAAAMSAIEIAMVFSTEFWPAALVMAIVFGLLAWRVPRGGRAALIGLSVAFLVELVPLPFYPRTSPGDWVVQGLTGVVSVVGLVLAVRLLVARRSVTVASG
jgi:hypothetical protein